MRQTCCFETPVTSANLRRITSQKSVYVYRIRVRRLTAEIVLPQWLQHNRVRGNSTRILKWPSKPHRCFRYVYKFCPEVLFCKSYTWFNWDHLQVGSRILCFCFALLPSFSFHKLQAASFQTVINQESGEIYYITDLQYGGLLIRIVQRVAFVLVIVALRWDSKLRE
jgi:hypothetical protein